jgi:RNA polymerase sigma factor (sigma-70 family)
VTTAWKSYRAQSPPSRRPPPDEERAPATMRSLDSPQDFAETFDRYFREIHGYIARRLGTGVADDIAAETFLIAYRKRASFDYQEGTVRAWLYGIATRLVSHHRRDELRAYRALQRAAARPATDDRMVDHTDRVTERVAAAAVQRELAPALAALSQGDRDVLLLVALADLTHAEVASALGIPYGTVGSRLSRARRQLRAALGPQDTEDSQE